MIYNLNEFGNAFKTQRKNTGLSYKVLSERSGIAMNTLRNIERGRVVPNIDTLAQLSEYLRIDLTNLFLSCKVDIYAHYDDLFTRFERMCSRHTNGFITQLMREAESMITAMEDITGDERLCQRVLQLYYRMIGYYEANVKRDTDMANLFYLKALDITIPGFSPEYYDTYTYSYEEIHILFHLVQVNDYLASKDYYLSMYHFIYDVYSQLVEREIYMFPTLVNNLAVAYLHRKELDKAMKFANIGLSFINKEQSNIDMPALMLCKGLILHYKKDDYAMFYIDLSFDLLVLSNRSDIIELALNEVRNRHGIDYRLRIPPLQPIKDNM